MWGTGGPVGKIFKNIEGPGGKFLRTGGQNFNILLHSAGD